MKNIKQLLLITIIASTGMIHAMQQGGGFNPAIHGGSAAQAAQSNTQSNAPASANTQEIEAAHAAENAEVANQCPICLESFNGKIKITHRCCPPVNGEPYCVCIECFLVFYETRRAEFTNTPINVNMCTHCNQEVSIDTYRILTNPNGQTFYIFTLPNRLLTNVEQALFTRLHNLGVREINPINIVQNTIAPPAPPLAAAAASSSASNARASASVSSSSAASQPGQSPSQSFSSAIAEAARTRARIPASLLPSAPTIGSVPAPSAPLSPSLLAASPSSSPSTTYVPAATSSSSSGKTARPLTAPQFGDCPSCLESLNPESHVIIRCECRHNFHLDCILLWLGRTENPNKLRTCPICRARVIIYDPIEFAQNVPYQFDQRNNQYRLVGSNRAPTLDEIDNITRLRALTNVTISDNQRPQHRVPVPTLRITPAFQRPAEPELPIGMISRAEWEANRRAAPADGQRDIGPYPEDRAQQGPNNAPAPALRQALAQPGAANNAQEPVDPAVRTVLRQSVGARGPGPHYVPAQTMREFANVIELGEWTLERNARRLLGLPDIGDYPGSLEGVRLENRDAFGNHHLNVDEQVAALVIRRSLQRSSVAQNNQLQPAANNAPQPAPAAALRQPDVQPANNAPQPAPAIAREMHFLDEVVLRQYRHVITRDEWQREHELRLQHRLTGLYREWQIPDGSYVPQVRDAFGDHTLNVNAQLAILRARMARLNQQAAQPAPAAQPVNPQPAQQPAPAAGAIRQQTLYFLGEHFLRGEFANVITLDEWQREHELRLQHGLPGLPRQWVPDDRVVPPAYTVNVPDGSYVPPVRGAFGDHTLNVNAQLAILRARVARRNEQAARPVPAARPVNPQPVPQRAPAAGTVRQQTLHFLDYSILRNYIHVISRDEWQREHELRLQHGLNGLHLEWPIPDGSYVPPVRDAFGDHTLEPHVQTGILRMRVARRNEQAAQPAPAARPVNPQPVPQPAPAVPAVQPLAPRALHFVTLGALRNFAHVIERDEWRLEREARLAHLDEDIGEYQRDGRYRRPIIDAFGDHDRTANEQVDALAERAHQERLAEQRARAVAQQRPAAPAVHVPPQLVRPAEQRPAIAQPDIIYPNSGLINANQSAQVVAPQVVQAPAAENKSSFSTFLKQYVPEMLGGLLCGYVMSGELQSNKDEQFRRVLGARRVLTYGPAFLAANTVLARINPQRTWDVKNIASWGVGIAGGLLLPYILNRPAPNEQNERQRP